MKTEQELRERAAEICADFDQLGDGLPAFAAECKAKLSVLDSEIDDLDHRLDAEKVGDVQRLLLLHEQRKQLEKKFVRERAKIIADAQKKSAAAGAAVADFIRAVHHFTASEVETFLIKNCEGEQRARTLAGQVDSVRALTDLVALCGHPRVKPESFLSRVRRFADGGRLWGGMT